MKSPSPQNNKLVFLACALILVLVGWLDWVCPHDLSVLLLYIIPVWMASWFLGLGSVVAFSLAAVIYQTFVQVSHPAHVYTYAWIPYWNAGMRMGTLLLLGYYVVKVRFFLREREELIAITKEQFAEAWDIGGLFPMCPGCKQMRTDDGYVTKVRSYLDRPEGARFVHFTCPGCAKVFQGQPKPGA